MTPPAPRLRFRYFAPTSLEEALHILNDHRGEAKILAGGMSLIPLMKLRFAAPGYVVDINGVKGLDIHQGERRWRIAAHRIARPTSRARVFSLA